MSVHILIALRQNRSWAAAMWASASATVVATVMKVPTIACAPIFWIRLTGAAALYLHSCIQTFEVSATHLVSLFTWLSPLADEKLEGEIKPFRLLRIVDIIDN